MKIQFSISERNNGKLIKILAKSGKYLVNFLSIEYLKFHVFYFDEFRIVIKIFLNLLNSFQLKNLILV